MNINTNKCIYICMHKKHKDALRLEHDPYWDCQLLLRLRTSVQFILVVVVESFKDARKSSIFHQSNLCKSSSMYSLSDGINTTFTFPWKRTFLLDEDDFEQRRCADLESSSLSSICLIIIAGWTVLYMTWYNILYVIYQRRASSSLLHHRRFKRNFTHFNIILYLFCNSLNWN